MKQRYRQSYDAQAAARVGDPFLTLRHVRFGSIVLQNDFAHPSAQD